ncbi:MAG: biosynthetic-type acetolactate synthase large subunit [Oscillospiraceae bacterium]|nr:biosynthetic-type acetolactate synthase large subunit [Oscillospiraceae bacterium]
MKRNGAQIVVEQLCVHGVDTVFGYPGGSVLPLYDELYKNAHRVHHIITAHEQGATHAADGYARVSGKTGVVIATSGPGATNLVTGIANAYLDSVPLVAITGNVSVPLLGKDSFQEVDIVGMTQPIVKHNFVVRDVKALRDTLREAFHIANSGRRGPVLVDIPRSVQEDICEYEDAPPLEGETQPTAPFDTRQAVQAIRGCHRPYIYAGGGVLASGAEAELTALAERLSAPVGFSMMGLTAMPHHHSLNLGMCGMHGRYAASVAQSECDVMLALGVRFSDRATGNVEAFGQGRVIIHVDIDLAEIDKNIPSHIAICGDVKAVLADLLRALPPMKGDAWLARVEELKQAELTPPVADFSPRNIMEAVSGFCREDAVVATDVGQHQMWTMQSYPFVKPRTLLTSGGLGAMGYGMGAAIGGCLADGKRRAVLITSDGSFGMNLTELATAVAQELPLLIVILNNGVLGMVRQWQTMFYGQRYSQTTLDRRTDFPALARAFGAAGYRAESLPQLADILGRLPAGGPAVIDCRIDRDERVLPMIPPGGSVQNIVRG